MHLLNTPELGDTALRELSLRRYYGWNFKRSRPPGSSTTLPSLDAAASKASGGLTNPGLLKQATTSSGLTLPPPGLPVSAYDVASKPVAPCLLARASC